MAFVCSKFYIHVCLSFALFSVALGANCPCTCPGRDNSRRYDSTTNFAQCISTPSRSGRRRRSCRPRRAATSRQLLLIFSLLRCYEVSVCSFISIFLSKTPKIYPANPHRCIRAACAHRATSDRWKSCRGRDIFPGKVRIPDLRVWL